VTARRLAWTLWAFAVGAVVVRVPVDLAVPDTPNDWGEYVFAIVAVALYATIGALITSRQLGNRVGLLFSVVALSAGMGLLAGSYASLADARDLPFAAAASWVGQLAFVTMIGPLAFLFLIFPTGRPPSRRWGVLLRVMLVAYGIAVLLFVLTPGPLEAGFAQLDHALENPVAFPQNWEGPVETLTAIAGFVVLVGALLSIVSLIQRYRQAPASERQQIRWLAFLGAFIAMFILVVFPLGVTGVIPEEGAVSNVTFLVLISLIFLGVPITCGVAILRYGLWDLDVVVKKTVQYGVLVVATIAVVGTLLFLLPIMFVGLDRDLLPGVVVGVVLSVLVAMLRLPARRLADRIVYGGRATPYEVLSEFAGHLGETYATEDVLPRMARLLGEATGARVARVWLSVGGTMRPAASWPVEGAPSADVPAKLDAEGRPPENEHVFEVRHQGELLGALSVTPAPDDPITPSKDKLARDMAAQAGLVLRNVGLIEEVRESRRRIVAAQDERARKLERDIHDGAQQQLVALSVKLGLVERVIRSDPATAEAMVAQAKRETTEALENLRDLARGVYPPVLADQGLAAALRSQARKSPIPVEIEQTGIERYPQDAEAAVYFSCLEALQNVAKYADATTATVRLAQTNGSLTFEVTDDGRGFDPAAAERGSGLQGIADRLAALGGTLTVRSAPGAGTTIAGSLPVEAAT
jgi:signal transduction histidine kinase